MSRDLQRAFFTASNVRDWRRRFFAAHPGSGPSGGVDPSQMRTIALRGRNGFALDDGKLIPVFRTIGRAARCDGGGRKSGTHSRSVCAVQSHGGIGPIAGRRTARRTLATPSWLILVPSFAARRRRWPLAAFPGPQGHDWRGSFRRAPQFPPRAPRSAPVGSCERDNSTRSRPSRSAL